MRVLTGKQFTVQHGFAENSDDPEPPRLHDFLCRPQAIQHCKTKRPGPALTIPAAVLVSHPLAGRFSRSKAARPELANLVSEAIQGCYCEVKELEAHVANFRH